MQKVNTVIAIDVVIPSFRLLPETLLPILRLERPSDATIRFYLIVDNPFLVLAQSILDVVDNEHVFLTINKTNQGASVTRNIGFESGQAPWVLFLDDDVVVNPNLLFIYCDAALQHPDEIGFIGVVNLPPPPTPFAQAVIANASMSMFTIAQTQPSYAWGVTANLMISRDAVGQVRFADIYPKTGGGEDVEFGFRVRERNNFKNYKCLPLADVTHPWWKKGKADLLRFYRYGLGISYLPQRNPRYRSYNFLNTVETAFVATLVLLFAVAVWPNSPYLGFYPHFLLLTVVLEYLISLRITMKSSVGFAPKVAMYVMLLRYSSETGVFWGNLKRGRVVGLGERFHFNGRTTKRNFGLNSNKIIKLVIYLLAIAYVLAKY